MVYPTPLHAATTSLPSVLIVDDDEYVHGALEAALRGLRVNLLLAGTAEEGIGLAIRHRPVLAIVDVGLPDRDGYELIADLRRIGSLADLRILILTGGSANPRAAKTAGANGVILKPFRLHQFLDLVREQLDGRVRDEAPPTLVASALARLA
jgi:two-component system, OmpR family, KDP operon response regulator KdpE